jgi:hypothetical protein
MGIRRCLRRPGRCGRRGGGRCARCRPRRRRRAAPASPSRARAAGRAARPPAGRGDGRPGPRHPRRRRRAPPLDKRPIRALLGGLLVDGQLGQRKRLEPLVGDRSAAQDRAAVGARSQAVLGPLQRLDLPHPPTAASTPLVPVRGPVLPLTWDDRPAQPRLFPGQVVNFTVGGARSSGPGGRAARVLLVSRL